MRLLEWRKNKKNVEISLHWLRSFYIFAKQREQLVRRRVLFLFYLLHKCCLCGIFCWLFFSQTVKNILDIRGHIHGIFVPILVQNFNPIIFLNDGGRYLKQWFLHQFANRNWLELFLNLQPKRIIEWIRTYSFSENT